MTPSFHPEPQPQNDLERLMHQAADDPALDGRMWRMMWGSTLCTFVPDHPEMYGKLTLEAGAPFKLNIYPSERGPFIVVFTSAAAAEWATERIPLPKPALAALPAEALFKSVNNGKLWVRINHGMRGTVVLDPAGVTALVNAQGMPAASLRADGWSTLVDALPVEFPAEFLETVRRFCEERRWALGVYAFFVASDTSSAIDYHEVRLVVWLRAPAPALLEEFQAKVNAVTPRGQRVTCTGATADRPDLIEFLQSRPTLWPVV